MTLRQELLDEIDRGFSHDALSNIVASCSKYLQHDSPDTEVFVIQQCCFWVKEHLDSIEPVRTDTHKEIENAFCPSLKLAINNLGKAKFPSEQLISAYITATQIRN